MGDKETKVIEAARVIVEYTDGIPDCHACLFCEWCAGFYDPSVCIATILDWIES